MTAQKTFFKCFPPSFGDHVSAGLLKGYLRILPLFRLSRYAWHDRKDPLHAVRKSYFEKGLSTGLLVIAETFYVYPIKLSIGHGVFKKSALLTPKTNRAILLCNLGAFGQKVHSMPMVTVAKYDLLVWCRMALIEVNPFVPAPLLH